MIMSRVFYTGVTLALTCLACSSNPPPEANSPEAGTKGETTAAASEAKPDDSADQADSKATSDEAEADEAKGDASDKASEEDKSKDE